MYRGWGSELNNDINFDTAFLLNKLSDDKFLDTNILRWMWEMKDLRTTREFLLWMRRKYSPSLPKDNLSFNDFDVMQRNYQCSDARLQRNKNFIGIYSNGLQFPSSEKRSCYQDQNTIHNDGYTYQKGNDTTKSTVALNNSNLMLNGVQKFLEMSRDSQNNTVFSRKNQCMQKGGLRKTKAKGNRKRKNARDDVEVIDLTVEDSVEMPYNLSKNPVNVCEVITSNVEKNLVCFAPYEEYETDFDYVDENSILAKHLRNYRNIFEAKRLKTSHDAPKDSEFVQNKQNLNDQLQCNNVQITAENMCFNDGKEVNSKSDDVNGEQEIGFQFRIDPELYLNDEFEQNEAIDYSIKSQSESHLETSGGKQVDSSLNSERLGGSVSDRVSPSVENTRADPFLKSSGSDVALNKNSKGNFSAQEDLVTSSACNKTNCSERATLKRSGKNKSFFVKKNTGVVNCEDELGLAIPKNNTTALGEDKSDSFSTNESNKKDGCSELFRLLTTDFQCDIYLRNKTRKTDDMETDNTCTGREKKTLEDVIDTMISDIMDKEESW